MNPTTFICFFVITALVLWRQRKAYQRGYDDALNHVLNDTKQVRLFQPKDPNGLVRVDGMKHFYLTDIIRELKEMQWVRNKFSR